MQQTVELAQDTVQKTGVSFEVAFPPFKPCCLGVANKAASILSLEKCVSHPGSLLSPFIWKRNRPWIWPAEYL